jgi:threonine dehydrogenase-like Zn-dependent dehydrogenase
VERGILLEHGFSTPLWLDRPEHLCRVPPELAPWAVLTEPLSVAEKGINEAICVQRARLGDDWGRQPPRVLATGLGPIAFAAALAAIARGWPTAIYGRDPPDSYRARLAASLGVRYLHGALSALAGDDPEVEGWDLLVECTGSDEVLVEASSAMAACAAIVWLGSHRLPEPVSLNVARMMRDGLLRNHLHIGSVNAAPRDFRDAIAHLGELRRRHGEQLSALITARVAPRAESLWHYQRRQPQGIKTVVEYAS